MTRYEAYRRDGEALSFIRDNQTGEVVRGMDHRIRSFKGHKTAEREAAKLNPPPDLPLTSAHEGK